MWVEGPASAAVRKVISGKMILTPTRGRRKPTSGEQQEMVPSDFPSAAKGISGPVYPKTAIKRISGNILPRDRGLPRYNSRRQPRHVLAPRRNLRDDCLRRNRESPGRKVH